MRLSTNTTIRPHTGRPHTGRGALVLTAFGLMTGAAHAQNDQPIFDPFGSAGDGFGIVAADGATLVIGAPGDDELGADAGSIRTYVQQPSGFVSDTRLFGSTIGPSDRFGSAVAIDGDLVVAGAPLDDDRGLDAGAAYVFRRANGGWSQEAKLTAAAALPDAFFGSAVAISGDVIVVGAYHAGNGTAHVFRRDPNGAWNEEAALSSTFGLYGFAVAASDERVAIGGFEAAEVYRSQGGGWVLESSLSSPAGPGGIFGNSLAMDGDRLVVGSWLDDGAASNAGAAFVFQRMPGGQWVYDDVLRASDAAANDFFGGSIALSGERVLVGAHADDDLGSNSGSAYVFEMVNGAWQQQQKLIASNGTTGDGFGGSVAVTPGAAIGGATNGDGAVLDSGAAYATTLTPPIGARLDLVPGRVEANYAAPGLIDVRLDYSLLLGGDIATSTVSFDVEVIVNGVSAHTESVTEFLALGIPACYSSNVPCVAGGCPGTVQCVWVDLPGTGFDYCACDWIGSLLMTVPGQLGDDVLLVLDVNDDVDETREENNFTSFVAGELGGTFCTSEPNSTGQSATIAAVGTAFVGQNDFSLQAAGLPTNAPSIFIVGPEANSTPLGTGTLCLGGSLLRVLPPVVSDNAGTVRQSLDLTQTPWLGTLTPGSTWRFQNWYRDGGSSSGFNLSDATSVAFAAEGQIEGPEVTVETAFQDPNAMVVGNPVYDVADMIGTQTFVRTPEFGRILIQVDAVELYLDGNGFIQLGYLEGPKVWGDAPIDGFVIDRRATAADLNWTPVTSLTNFRSGMAGTNADILVESVSFNKTRVNGFTILTIRELHGFDYASNVQISAAPSDLDEILCESYWEWRCANTACGGGCTYYEQLPNGKTKAACDCNIGFCNWLWLPNCMRINCTGSCTLSGVWDLCDC